MLLSRVSRKSKFAGGNTLIIYTESWQKIKEIPVSEIDFKVSKGKHSILLDCTFSAEEKEPALKIEICLTGVAQDLKL
jgi:hypothetical protein